MSDNDEYKVHVLLNFTSRGHHDNQFPDVNWSLDFDATDVNIDVMLEQFKKMLIAMDYVVDGKRLVLVEDYDE